jgi:ABC-type branched-subunit amino acid transport system substrate-binding protein
MGGGGGKGWFARFRAVSRSLHSHEFDTVLGRIRFDEKGDVIPSAFDWFIWTNGEFVPKDLTDYPAATVR